jgi:Predicted membrane protein
VPLSAERARFLRYAGVGVFTTLLDLTLFSVFAVVLGVPALAANVLSTCITVCFSYLANRLVVFRSDAGATKTFLPFVTVTLFSGLIVQSIVIWCVLHGGHAAQPSVSHDLLAPAGKVVAMAVGMAANYLGYRWLFGRHAGPGGVRCHRLPRRLRALCSDTWRCR